MKWVDGLTDDERARIRFEKFKERDRIKHMWTKWFAWFPVVIGKTPDGLRKVKVWLQYVERRREFKYPGRNRVEVWRYREIEKGEK